MSEEDFDFGEHRLQRAVDELVGEFRGIWSRETIDRFVHECHDYLHDQGAERIVNFGSLHAGRFARERLWALAQAEGRVEKTKPEALFVCVHNAGRSQMAAALTHQLLRRVDRGSLGGLAAGATASNLR